MTPKPVPLSVRDAERIFLRRFWWLFPLAGWGLGALWGGFFWQWVAGRHPLPLAPGSLWGLRQWTMAGVGLLVPLAWFAGLNLRPPRVLSLGLALVVVLSVDVVLSRSSTLQAAVWLAARTRLEAGQHFMREVCYVRLEEAAGRRVDEPGVVLVGSSQVLAGVDDHLLRDLLAPVPVIRRAMFGMSPLKALSMMAYLPFRPGDICILYLSEFDFTNQDAFPHDWFRPYASWQTLPAVLHGIPRNARIRYWRQSLDYVLAASFELWRDRDFIRQIAFHFWGGAAEPAQGGSDGERAEWADRARGPVRVAPAEFPGFFAFARNAGRRGVQILVFEGEVNPTLHSEARAQAQEQVRIQLQEWAGTSPHRYVSIEEQGLQLSPHHWLDHTHLNAAGRERLTRRIAREVTDLRE